MLFADVRDCFFRLELISMHPEEAETFVYKIPNFLGVHLGRLQFFTLLYGTSTKKKGDGVVSETKAGER